MALVPASSEYDTLEAWLEATCKALGTTISRLSIWCGLNVTTLWLLVREPKWAMIERTQQRLHESLGIPFDELNRLRPSKVLRRESHRHVSLRVRMRYGPDYYKQLGVKGMGAMSARRTPEEMDAYRRLAREAHAAKYRGKPRQMDDRWRARIRLEKHKRRLVLDREQIRQLYESGKSQQAIAACLGVSRFVVHREMYEMGIAQPLKRALLFDQRSRMYHLISPGLYEGPHARGEQQREHSQEILDKAWQAAIEAGYDPTLMPGATLAQWTKKVDLLDEGVSERTARKYLKRRLYPESLD